MTEDALKSFKNLCIHFMFHLLSRVDDVKQSQKVFEIACIWVYSLVPVTYFRVAFPREVVPQQTRKLELYRNINNTENNRYYELLQMLQLKKL